jgi:hypothetical protein
MRHFCRISVALMQLIEPTGYRMVGHRLRPVR